jgi:hypothetical protein
MYSSNYSSLLISYVYSSVNGSRIHERKILFSFLGIILRVFRLEVSVWTKPLGRGYGFLSGFPSFSFTVYSN